MGYCNGGRFSSSLGLLFVGLLLPLGGCGPLAIGGIASSRSGGDGPPAPRVTAPSAAVQPFDGRTLIQLQAAQATGRPIRFRLEYGVGAGPMQPVPPEQIAGYDPATGATAPFPPQDDANQQWIVPTTADGLTHWLVWDHAAALGQDEVRGVTLRLRFGDSERATPASLPLQADVLADATIGREAGELRGLKVAPRTDPEAPIVVRGQLWDRGGDAALCAYDLEIAWERDTGGTPKWQPLTTQPTFSNAHTAEGMVVHDWTLSIDPLDPTVGLPRQQLDELVVRVALREVFAEGSRFPAADPVRAGGEEVVGPVPILVGATPALLSAHAPDPAAEQGGLGRPWLLLPITAALHNPSTREAMTVRIDVDVAVAGEPRHPAELTVTQDPRTSREVTVAPGTTVVHRALWNVAADEGLGLTLQPAPTLARLFVRATRMPGAPAAPGTLIQSSEIEVGPTGLLTNPFAAFRERLAEPAARPLAAGARTDQGELFTTAHPTAGASANQVLVLRSAQHAAALGIPGILPLDFTLLFPGETSGVRQITPTDFAAGPDCIVRNGGNAYWVRWGGAPDPEAPAAVQLPGTMPGLHTRPVDRAAFTLGGRPAALLFAHDNANPVTGELDVYLIVVLQAGPQWVREFQRYTLRLPTVPGTGSNVSTELSVVGGEWDGDPTSFDVVVGNVGTEYDTRGVGREGALHVFSLRPTAQAGPYVEFPPGGTALATAPLPRANATVPAGTRIVRRWVLRPWTMADGTRGLCLLRDLAPTLPEYGKETDAHVLLQDPSGRLAGQAWQLLTHLSDPGLADANLLAAHTADLDADLGGIPGADLLLAYERSPNGPDNANEIEVWLHALRGHDRKAHWRRVVDDLPATTATRRIDDCRVADVNGDHFPDLLLWERDGTLPAAQQRLQQGWYYLPGSQTGVAGAIADLPPAAGAAATRLPGVADLNGDGRPDLVADQRVLVRQPDGSFAAALAGLAGGNGSLYHVEQILAPGTSRAEFDVLVHDRTTGGAQNGVERIRPTPAGLQRHPDFLPVENGGLPVVFARPVTTPSSAGTGRKDVFLIQQDASGHLLWRTRLVGSTFRRDPTPALAVPVLPVFARIRQGDVMAGADPRTNALVEDVVVVKADGSEVIVLAAAQDYTELLRCRIGTATAGEQVLALAAACADDDGTDAGREDLLLLTRGTGATLRLTCLRQLAGDVQESLYLPGAPVRRGRVLLQFDAPYGADTAVRAFAFDRRSHRHAQGVLVLDDATGANGDTSVVRVVLPATTVADGFHARMVRSTLTTGTDADLNAVVLDAHGAGQLDVFLGEDTPAGRLRQVDRGFRSP